MHLDSVNEEHVSYVKFLIECWKAEGGLDDIVFSCELKWEMPLNNNNNSNKMKVLNASLWACVYASE